MLGAVWMTSGQLGFFFGRLPKKLLIPLILVTNLSSSTLTFLADNQNVLNSKTISLWCLSILWVWWDFRNQ